MQTARRTDVCSQMSAREGMPAMDMSPWGDLAWVAGQTLVKAAGKDTGLLVASAKMTAGVQGSKWKEQIFKGYLMGFESKDASNPDTIKD